MNESEIIFVTSYPSLSREVQVAVNSGQGNRGAARALFRRSASLVAAEFAELYNFKGKPKN